MELVLGRDVVPQEEGFLVVTGPSRKLVVSHLRKVPASPVLRGLLAPAAGHEASLLGIAQPGEVSEPGGLEGALELLHQGLGPREREVLDSLAVAAQTDYLFATKGSNKQIDRCVAS